MNEQNLRFSCFAEDISSVESILTMDSVIKAATPTQIRQKYFAHVPEKYIAFDEADETFPTEEDKAIVTLPPSAWEPVPRDGKKENATSAGDYWKWEEPFLYSDPDKCKDQPRTIIARCVGTHYLRDETSNVIVGGAFLFVPVAIKNDRAFLEGCIGKPLLRPIWMFERHACCIDCRCIEKETDIMKSIRIAGE